MGIPHRFPSILSGDKRPILVIGAGLSRPDITTQEIVTRLCAVVATPKNCVPLEKPCPDGKEPSQCLYCLAQEYLDKNKSAPDRHKRLALAEDIGIFSNERWNGQTDLPLSRNHPRHRAIARLAADKRFQTIVSLNWDCFLEAAFDAIGLKADDPAPQRPGDIGGHVAVVTHLDQAKASNPRLFPILKPHGSRRNLDTQRRSSPGTEPIFVITDDDLKSAPTNNPDVFTQFRNALKGVPLVVAGWAASEPYLKGMIEEIKPELPAEDDRLSIIALSAGFEQYLDGLTALYSTDKVHTLFAVQNEMDTDRLFRWVYAQYAISELAKAAIPGISPKVQEIVSDIPQPSRKDAYLYDFVDDFLPTWSRLCTCIGAVPFGTSVNPSSVPLTPRDWQVPFSTYGQGIGHAIRTVTLENRTHLSFPQIHFAAISMTPKRCLMRPMA